jgi:hypothetical protein
MLYEDGGRGIITTYVTVKGVIYENDGRSSLTHLIHVLSLGQNTKFLTHAYIRYDCSYVHFNLHILRQKTGTENVLNTKG